MGYVQAMKELDTQLTDMKQSISQIIFASSSGGTQAGMVVGNRLLGNKYQVIGIGIEKEQYGQLTLAEKVLVISRETIKHLEMDIDISRSDIDIRTAYSNSGYGVVSEGDREAIKAMAQAEGILLDPVYTGRAMAGLIDMIRSGQIDKKDRVLFWHTGGTAALYPYTGDLVWL